MGPGVLQDRRSQLLCAPGVVDSGVMGWPPLLHTLRHSFATHLLEAGTRRASRARGGGHLPPPRRCLSRRASRLSVEQPAPCHGGHRGVSDGRPGWPCRAVRGLGRPESPTIPAATPGHPRSARHGSDHAEVAVAARVVALRNPSSPETCPARQQMDPWCCLIGRESVGA
jgi:hypothetical protein